MAKIPKIKRMPKMEPIDITPLLEKYEGKWVALTEYSPNSQVICSGGEPKAVYDRARKKGYDSPVIFMVSRQYAHAMIF